MFKLKKGNVIQKINSMDRKQIYTYGGVAIAVIVALLLLASFLGNAEDPSFEGFSSRGYDLANSPFVTDEAEQALLASKYPDMQEQPSNFLYSEEEKEARQEADGVDPDALDEEALDTEEEDFSSGSSGSGSSTGSSSGSRGYGGYRGSGAGRQPTTINSMGHANQAQAGGHGVSGYWGGPNVDNRPYQQRDIDTGKIQTQKEQTPDAKRALSQFSKGAQLAAGMKDNRALNIKRAVMGADSKTGAVDLKDVKDSSQLDTSAPQNETPDLQALKDEVKDTANNPDKNKNDNKVETKESFLEQLGKQLLDIGLKLGEHMLTQWLDDKWQDRREFNKVKGTYTAGWKPGEAAPEWITKLPFWDPKWGNGNDSSKYNDMVNQLTGATIHQNNSYKPQYPPYFYGSGQGQDQTQTK